MLKLERINNGNMNDVFILHDTNNKYIIRISQFNNLFECRILKLLEQFDFNSPRLLTNFNLDSNNIMIYRYIEGKNPKEFNNQFFMELAKLLQKLHAICSPFQKKDYEMNEETIEKLKQYYDVAIKSKYLYNDSQYIKEIYNQTLQLNFNTLPKCIIHSDIKEENLIINDKHLSLIDFGNVYIGSRLIDLVRIIMWFFIRYDNYDYNAINNFISNYFKNNMILNNEEVKNILLIIKFCILYNLLKDLYLFENNILKKDYIENNSLIWLTAIKDEKNLLKIGEVFENVKRFTK